MAKKFEELRKKMSIESQKRSARKAAQIIVELEKQVLKKNKVIK